MAKRSSQPALYEMMKRRSRAAEQGNFDADSGIQPTLRLADDTDAEIMRDDVAPSPVLERILKGLQPGQVLRVPVGYVLAACAAVILLLLITYMLGVGKGKSIQAASFREKFGDGFEISSSRANVNDPLSPVPVDQPQAARSSHPESIQDASRQGDRSVQGADLIGARPPSAWGPIAPISDPRQKGWNYFIVAETTTAGGQRLAQFCRDHGLESYALPYKNKCRVIVFPGFEGARDAPEVRALEARIHQVGDKYKAANRHETDMRDAYPSKFDG